MFILLANNRLFCLFHANKLFTEPEDNFLVLFIIHCYRGMFILLTNSRLFCLFHANKLFTEPEDNFLVLFIIHCYRGMFILLTNSRLFCLFHANKLFTEPEDNFLVLFIILSLVKLLSFVKICRHLVHYLPCQFHSVTTGLGACKPAMAGLRTRKA